MPGPDGILQKDGQRVRDHLLGADRGSPARAVHAGDSARLEGDRRRGDHHPPADRSGVREEGAPASSAAATSTRWSGRSARWTRPAATRCCTPARSRSEANRMTGENYFGWRNPRADELLAKARSTPDESERLAAYREHQELFMEDLPGPAPLLPRPDPPGPLGCPQLPPDQLGAGRGHLERRPNGRRADTLMLRAQVLCCVGWLQARSYAARGDGAAVRAAPRDPRRAVPRR